MKLYAKKDCNKCLGTGKARTLIGSEVLCICCLSEHIVVVTEKANYDLKTRTEYKYPEIEVSK